LVAILAMIMLIKSERSYARSTAKALLNELIQGNWEHAFEYVNYHDGPVDEDVHIAYEEAKAIWVNRVKELQLRGTFLKDYSNLQIRMDDGWAQGNAVVTLVENGEEKRLELHIGFQKVDG